LLVVFLKLNHEELEQLGDIIKAENPDNTVDFINIVNDRENYVIHNNIADMTELGKEVARQQYGFSEESPLGMDVNYEELGEKFHDAHEGIFQDGKYIIKPPIPNNPYDGVALPGTDKLGPDSLLAVQLVSRKKFKWYTRQGNGDDIGGIWVTLPTTQYALDRTAHLLGENSADDCLIYHAQSLSAILAEQGYLFNAADSPYEVNTLAEIVASYSDPATMEKFEAVMSYEEAHLPKLPDVINYACNLDCYEYDPEIQSPEDFVIHTYGDDPVRLARADEFDGEKLLAKCGGKITEYGFVARNEQPMKQVYKSPEPEQGQGISM
jgi:hypothetical protein